MSARPSPRNRSVTVATLVAALFAGIGAASAAGEVNVYSSRHYNADKLIYGAFEKATGIRVNVVEGQVNALFERLRREGRNSPADVLITVDAGNLGRAQLEGLFQPMKSGIVESVVPDHLREPDGLWTALSMRARVLMYHKDRVDPSELSTYEALVDPKWKGRILVRSSGNIYNQSMMAAMIEIHGRDKALGWARGLVANFAQQPKGGDRDQIKAVGAGLGDVAISNTYYLGLLSASDAAADKALVSKIGVFFPDQDGRGTHVNVSGAGIARHAPNPANAVKLIEFLLSKEIQELVANENFEYPVRGDVAPPPVVAAWGPFKADRINVTVLGKNNAEAVKVMDQAGWR